MTDGRLKALGTVASTLGASYLFNIIDRKEAEELYFLVRVFFVSASRFDQTKEMQILKEQERIRNCIGSNETIRDIYEHGYKVLNK